MWSSLISHLQLVLEHILLVGELAIQSKDLLLFLGKGLMIFQRRTKLWISNLPYANVDLVLLKRIHAADGACETTAGEVSFE